MKNPFQAAPEVQCKDRHYQVLCREHFKQMSHPSPRGTVLQREAFRAKPAEGISTNSKFGLKDQVVTMFPTIAPSCYISIVQIQNEKIIPSLEMSQAEASEAYSRDKGRAEAFPQHGEEGEKEKEVVWGFASNHIQHNGFLNLHQRRDSTGKHSKPSPIRSHQGVGSTITGNNPFRSFWCKQVNRICSQISHLAPDLQSNLKWTASRISAPAYLFTYFNLKVDLAIRGSQGSISLA